MALAWLTRSLAAAENMEVHAFIVDHGARPECAEEARSVAQIMKGYNFQPHILRLSWDSKTLRGGFETHARILRYRALARACVENRIRHVMLGHHSDDLAETVLMRLLLSSRTEGLAGMRQKVPMPETWGIYGADGIYIGRPLLNCSKIRLKRTIRDAQVPWFEDKTNTDPTFTKRNTIRKLLYSKPCRLPRALQKPALVRMAYSAARWNLSITLKAQRVLSDECRVRVNSKTGSLAMTVPETTLRQIEEKEANVLVKVLTLAAEMVTPLRTVKRKSMINAFANIFGRDSTVPITFTAAGLSWSRDDDRTLTLRRVPHSLRTLDQATVHVKLEGPKNWTEWILWDGRWWIRLQSLGPNPKEVIIRPLQLQDMKQLRARLRQLGRSHMVNELIDGLQSLPSKSQFTVPVIVTDEILVGLPSFHVHLMNQKSPRLEDGRLIEWEAWFRKPI